MKSILLFILRRIYFLRGFCTYSPNLRRVLPLNYLPWVPIEVDQYTRRHARGGAMKGIARAENYAVF